MESKKSKPLLYDRLILKRVKEYLEENVDKTFVDIPEMTRYLQARYPEYARRKQSPLKQLVEQAYRIVSKQVMREHSTTTDESEMSDLEVMADSSSHNIMNNLMSNLYSKTKPELTIKPVSTSASASVSASASAVAIDISSDESDNDAPTGSGEQMNGRAQKTVIEQFSEVFGGEMGMCGPSPGGGGGDVGRISRASSSSSQSAPAIPHASKKRKRKPDMPQVTIKRNGGSSFAPCVGFNAAINAGPNNPMVNPSHGACNVGVTILNAPGRMNPTSTSMGRPPAGAACDPHSNAQSPQLQQPHSQQHTSQSSRPPHGPPPQQRPRRYKKELQLRKPSESFRDIGGMESALIELCDILLHVKAPEAYFALGLMPPRGILLHGPSGCGKTLLARAIAGQLDLPLCEVPATELIAGVSGESEQRIRDVFEQAAACGPCILFIDEIDAISANRSMAQRDMERRIVSQLISSMDDIRRTHCGQSILVIGATTRPDVLDPSLRRVGRFDHEIAISVPSRKDRKQILEVLCDGVGIDPMCDFDKVAEITPGFVGADLLALISRAATLAVKRRYSQQLHAFQMNALTIVDLDADDGESDIGKKNAIIPEEMEGVESMQTDEVNDADAVEEKAADSSGAAEATPVVADKADAVAGDKADSVAGDKADAVAGDKADTVAEEKPAENAAEPMTDAVPAEPMESTVENSITAEASSSAEAISTVDSAMNISAKSDIVESSSVTSQTDLNGQIRKPTLTEMLNWLDNPPDNPDIAESLCITFEDIRQAVKLVQPSAKREGFITVPDITWDDVGSLQDIREELKLAVLAPVKYPEMLLRLGINAPSGVLLCGPPGCGKTLLAKAIANEAGINFISVKGPEMMNMYVGESERAVRACFQRARNSAPCVIFFDEFDSLCPKRSEGNDSGSGTRIVNQLLTEMDGIEERKGVYLLAATNRPDIIDPAILRPGRLDTILYVGLPQELDRVEILKATTKNGSRPVLANDVDFIELAKKTDGYTGADLAGLIKQASMLALKEALNNANTNTEDLCVNKKHLEEAIRLMRPSISDQDRIVYEKLRLKYAAPRALEVLKK